MVGNHPTPRQGRAKLKFGLCADPVLTEAIFEPRIGVVIENDFHFEINVVPLAGLEPARCFHHLILSQARLPIPPQGPAGADHTGRPGRVNAEMGRPHAHTVPSPRPSPASGRGRRRGALPQPIALARSGG
jgi:hypothetical protein